MPAEKLPAGLVRLYDAFEDNDQTEGKGGLNFLGRFDRESVARKIAKGKGPMGADSRVNEVICIVIDGIAYPVDLDDGHLVSKTAKDALINSMTPEQRKILRAED